MIRGFLEILPGLFLLVPASRLVKMVMRRGCSTAETFSTSDPTSLTGLKPSWGGEEENVVLALVIAFLMLLELNERFP
jgi:hypothetical protein